MPYSHSVSGLRIQIDAAINPGNSGGPAVAGDKMIGLAFSHLGNAQNIGYIIPNEEIELFLKDIADGRYDGKPAMYDELQTLENPALRAFLKLDSSVQGVVVHQPLATSASYPLKEWDVITRIADTPIDDQGMIKLGSNLRVNFRYLIQQVASDSKVPLTIVRAGKPQQIQLAVAARRPLLISDLGRPARFLGASLRYLSMVRMWGRSRKKPGAWLLSVVLLTACGPGTAAASSTTTPAVTMHSDLDARLNIGPIDTAAS